ncbi:MAG: hypothetical protein M1823_003597 [Watsoniomyces obsoletus]|nr:MAG: hypothetical protein M1823_003597 [Watsoniomyces obsoletus]
MDDTVNLPRCLEDVQLPTPPAAYYVTKFISAAEEQELLQKIHDAPTSRWTNLSWRRLQAYPSQLSAKNGLLATPLLEWLLDPIIPRLRNIPIAKDNLESLENHLFDRSPHQSPNHVLINEYEPGQGIMPHEDGAAYWPVVATVSLGAPIVLEIYGKDSDGRREQEPQWRILQEARRQECSNGDSLLITTGSLYTDFLHGITETSVDEDLGPESIVNWNLLGAPQDYASGQSPRRTRTSLTYRDVLKVSHLSDKLGLSKRA